MSGNWVYIVTDGGNLRTVGFYDPAGKWQPDSDHSSEAAAAARVNYLNGGHTDNADLIAALQGMIDNFKPFTMKPVGAPNSQARADQDAQIAAHKAARSALAKAGVR